MRKLPSTHLDAAIEQRIQGLHVSCCSLHPLPFDVWVSPKGSALGPGHKGQQPLQDTVKRV